MKRSIVFATLLLLAISVAMAEQAALDPTMVYLRVNVLDNAGRVVTGLPKDAFRLSEDNVPQDLAYFSNAETSASIALLMDTEASLRNQIEGMAVDGLGRSLSPGQEFVIADAKGLPLNDSMHEALNKLQQRPTDRRALIVFTTRLDPASRSFSKVKEILKDNDLRLYVISIPRQNSTGETMNPLLRELAEGSGGAAYFPQSVVYLTGVYRAIARDLKHEYLLGYRPSNKTTDGKWRKIKVNAKFQPPAGKAAEYRVRAKAGYYAPTKAQ